MKIAGFLLLLSSCFVWAQAPQPAIVRAPVADVRSVPSEAAADERQETQVVFGERLQVLASSGAWVRVEVVDQPEYTHHNRWEGYPGWMRAEDIDVIPAFYTDELVLRGKWTPVYERPGGGAVVLRLPLGSRVRSRQSVEGWEQVDSQSGPIGWISSATYRTPPGLGTPAGLRREILRTAGLLIGDPYLWGGRSPLDAQKKAALSGVDCSGLVHLAYTVNGQGIPRDAHEQHMTAQKIERRDLQRADVIFLAKTDQPEKIVHVMLFAGGDQVIEAPQTGLPVRRIRIQDKLGKPLAALESGEKIKDRIIYFGRLLPS